MRPPTSRNGYAIEVQIKSAQTKSILVLLTCHRKYCPKADKGDWKCLRKQDEVLTCREKVRGVFDNPHSFVEGLASPLVSSQLFSRAHLRVVASELHFHIYDESVASYYRRRRIRRSSCGAELNKTLRVEVILLDRRNFHLFQPLLYQVATGWLSAANIASPLRVVLRKQKNARVLLAEVIDFDLTNRQLILADGKIDYDTLIIASGSGFHYFRP